MPGQRVSRSELYDLLWSEPSAQLAERFDISDVMLAKICAGAHIPKPGIGYWAKLHNGRMVERTPLPVRPLGQNDYIIFGSRSSWESAAIDDGPEFAEPSFEESFDEVVARARALVEKVPVRKSLTNPHPEIAKILRKDELQREKQARGSLGVYLYRAVSDSKQGRRRLVIANSLLKTLDLCGAGSAKTRGDAEEWSIHIGSQVLPFIFTSVDESRRTYSQNGDDTSPLKLAISWWEPPKYITLEWRDSDGGPLEGRIKEIVEGFLVAAEVMYREYEISEFHRLKERREEIAKSRREEHERAIRQEDLRLEKLTQDRRQELFHDAAKWRKAEELRAYVTAALAVPASSEEEQQNKSLWGAWALGEADQIDPLKKKDLEDER